MKGENGMIRIGISDFLQQRSEDVAFAEVKCEGSELAVSEEVATIETNKVNVDITTPVSGEIITVN